MSISSSSARLRTPAGMPSGLSPSESSASCSAAATLGNDPLKILLLRVRSVFELLVAALRDELGHRPAGRAELERDDARIADHLAAVLLQLLPVALEIV